MPRGKKKSYAEKIESVTNEMLACETRYKTLKEELKNLQDEQKNEELQHLHQIIQTSGLSIDDVLSMISQKTD